ncbi:MAG: 2OG-Fe(II) oxygenase [Cellvibrionaceae bacterium]|nr:2OG-Fe(II) oxygenase [Cellvibrionaceae bacterium]
MNSPLDDFLSELNDAFQSELNDVLPSELNDALPRELNEELFERIASALETVGWLVLQQGLPTEICFCLQQLNDRAGETFRTAGVGRGPERNRNLELRRDRIAWIEENDDLADPWHAWTDALQSYLNRRLFLGLFSFESHLALYRPGDFYRTHVDAFRGQSNRRLSLVAYLNPDWQPGQGGELVLYDPHTSEPLQTVAPELGTLVLFLSEEFPHEVLPAERERFSVAGWFRVNGSSGVQVDPPT